MHTCNNYCRINHYSSIYDVQTLAMLCCAYGSKNDGQRTQPQTPAMTGTKSSAKSPPDITVNNNNVSKWFLFLISWSK